MTFPQTAEQHEVFIVSKRVIFSLVTGKAPTGKITASWEWHTHDDMELRRLEPFDPRRGQSSPIFISLAPLADGSLYEIKNLDVKLVKP